MLVLCPWAMGAEGCSQVNSVQSGVQVGSKPTMSSVRVGVRKQGWTRRLDRVHQLWKCLQDSRTVCLLDATYLFNTHPLLVLVQLLQVEPLGLW